MGQEDTLKKQIDKLAKALAKILGKLSGTGNIATFESTAQVNATLKDELGYDLAELAAIPEGDFIDTLSTFHQFNSNHFNLLADVLFNVGNLMENPAQAKGLLSRAGVIYQHLKNTSKHYSMAWDMKIDAIGKALS